MDAGAPALERIYRERAPPNGFVLMVSGRLTALAAFVRAQPKLFYTHTQSVVMLGGALKPSRRPGAASGRAGVGDVAPPVAAAVSSTDDVIDKAEALLNEIEGGRAWSSADGAVAADGAKHPGDEMKADPSVQAESNPQKLRRPPGGGGGDRASNPELGGAWASEEGRFLTPDPAAQNVALDAPAAEFVFRMCQRLTVPLVVVSRHAANACWLPRSLYDAIACSGAPVGAQLRKQATAITASRAPPLAPPPLALTLCRFAARCPLTLPRRHRRRLPAALSLPLFGRSPVTRLWRSIARLGHVRRPKAETNPHTPRQRRWNIHYQNCARGCVIRRGVFFSV